MKKNLVIVILLTITSAVHSQNIRLNAYGSYVFDDKVDNYYSSTSYFNGTIKGGFIWGGGLEFRVADYYGIELIYQRLDTHTPLEYYDINESEIKNANFDLAINYLMVGGARSVKASEKLEPYGGFMLGMAFLDAKNTTNDVSHSATKFAAGARAGVNIWFSDRMGLKLQAQLITIPQGAGGSLYFGTGGAGAGVSTYSSMLQFTLGGGLAFKLGGSTPPTTAKPQM